MKKQTEYNTKIGSWLVTIFSVLWLIGGMGVNSTQAEILDNGIAKVLSFCDDGSGGALKEKFTNIAMADIDLTTFPNILATVSIGETDFLMIGVALAKNAKSGVFQLFGDDGVTSELAMNGKYKLDGNGTLVKVSGIFQTRSNQTAVAT